MIEYTVQVDENATRWFLNGLLHREDGPAYVGASGTNIWYLNGKELSEDEFNARTTTKELTVAQIEKLLGHKVKVVK